VTKEVEYSVLPIEPSAPPDFHSDVQPWGVGCSLMVAAFFLSAPVTGNSNSSLGVVISVILVLEIGAVALSYYIYDTRKSTQIDNQRKTWLQEQITDREKEAQERSQRARQAMDSFHSALQHLPHSLRGAGHFLDRAEEEFQERAYAPFWDNIEQAAIRLGSFNSNLVRLETEARSYNNILNGRVHNFPPLLIQGDEVPNPAGCADRLRQLVRRGQKDFEFATIWEHRKTQNVIMEGFRTFGEAVNNLGFAIGDSFSRATRTLEESSARQLEEQAKLRGSFETAVNRWKEQKRLYRT
jgi:hypothetical protein